MSYVKIPEENQGKELHYPLRLFESDFYLPRSTFRHGQASRRPSFTWVTASAKPFDGAFCRFRRTPWWVLLEEGLDSAGGPLVCILNKHPGVEPQTKWQGLEAEALDRSFNDRKIAGKGDFKEPILFHTPCCRVLSWAVPQGNGARWKCPSNPLFWRFQNLEFPDCAVISSELLPGLLGTINAILGSGMPIHKYIKYFLLINWYLLRLAT